MSLMRFSVFCLAVVHVHFPLRFILHLHSNIHSFFLPEGLFAFGAILERGFDIYRIPYGFLPYRDLGHYEYGV